MHLRTFSWEGRKGKTKYFKNKSEKPECFQPYNLCCQLHVSLFQKTMLPARESVLNATEIQVTDYGGKTFVPAYFQSFFFLLKESAVMEKYVWIKYQMPRKTFMLARKSFKSFLPICSLFWG